MANAIDPLEGSPKYQRVDSLNRGSCGFVNLYLNRSTREHVAIKFLARGANVSKYVEYELLNHRLLRHPHVVGFKEVFLTAHYICIVMEYANGGNLCSFVKTHGRLPEPVARCLFQQLIVGLDYCHKKGVVNRDIKLENTLLQKTPGQIPCLKICDFGYSKAQFLSQPKSTVGTLLYMAPEVLEAAEKYDGRSADVWSCGVMLYVMLFGAYPFDGSRLACSTASKPATAMLLRAKTMLQLIRDTPLQLPADDAVSSECRDLLQSLLVTDPAQRLPISCIIKHHWFLTSLPPGALATNEQCLADINYAGVQSVEEIRCILRSAAIPIKFDFLEEDAQLEDIIEEVMEEQMDGSGHSSQESQQQ